MPRADRSSLADLSVAEALFAVCMPGDPFSNLCRLLPRRSLWSSHRPGRCRPVPIRPVLKVGIAYPGARQSVIAFVNIQTWQKSKCIAGEGGRLSSKITCVGRPECCGVMYI